VVQKIGAVAESSMPDEEILIMPLEKALIVGPDISAWTALPTVCRGARGMWWWRRAGALIRID
jgi:hypothetical protein